MVALPIGHPPAPPGVPTLRRRQAKLRGMLENEAGGPSGYNTFRPDIDDPAEAGALSVPLWELALLAHHFHPHVAQVGPLPFLICRQPPRSALPQLPKGAGSLLALAPPLSPRACLQGAGAA